MELTMSLDETLPSGSMPRRGRRRASESSRASPRTTPRSLSKSLTSPLIDNEEEGNIDIVPSARSGISSGSPDISSLNLSDVVQQRCQECQYYDTAQLCLDCHTHLCNTCRSKHVKITGHTQTTTISNQSNILTIPDSSLSQCETFPVGDTLSDIRQESLAVSSQLKDNLFQLRRFRLENNEENLQTQLSSLVQEAEKHKKELINIIEHKHKRFVEEINGKFKSVFEMIRICDKKIEKVLDDIATIEKPRSLDERTDSEAQLKVLREIQSRNIKEYSEFESKRHSLKPVTGLTFRANKELRSVLKSTTFGKTVTKLSQHNGLSGNSSLDESGLDIATIGLQRTVGNVKKHQSHNKETVRGSTERNWDHKDTFKSFSCWTEGDYGSKTCITDIVKTKEGTILIADNNNKKLKLLRINGDEFDVCGSIDLGGEPWQIAPYKDNKYIVTVLKDLDHDKLDPMNDDADLSKPTCVVVDTLGYLAVERSFHLLKESTGVAVVIDNFTFCGYNGETAHIFVTDTTGNFLSMNTYCSRTGLKRPNYLCVSDDGAILYVSDADRGVFGLKTDNLGEILFRFQGKPKMKCPLGMTVCNNGDLLICASQSNALYRISKDGKQKDSIQIGQRGLQNVCAISESLAIVSSDEAGYELTLFSIKLGVNHNPFPHNDAF